MTRAKMGNVAGRAALAFSAILCVSGLCSSANAQFAADRQHTEGAGIRVGDLEIHPGVAARGGYDTNVFRGDGEKGGQPIKGAGILAITPHVALSTVGSQRASQGEDRGAEAGASGGPALRFRFGAAATYLQFFGVSPAVKNVAVDADGLVNIFPSRPVSLDLAAAYNRQIAPFTAAVQGAGNRTYAHDTLTPTVRLNIQSRGGVLRSSLGFTPLWAPYEGREFKYLSRVQYGVVSATSWKFLPTTALVHDLNLDFVDYYNLDASGGAFNTVLLTNSTRVQSRLGVNGALTNNLSIRVLAGYAVGFMDDRRIDEYQAPVGEAALIYRFGATTDTIEGGYQRAVTPAALGGNMTTDRGFARLSTVLAQRLSLGVSAGVGYVTYGRLITPSGDPLGAGGDTSRQDVRIDASINAEYRVTNYLAFLADLNAFSTLTDFKYGGPAVMSGMIPPDPAKFTAFQFFGGVRLFY